MAQHTNYTSRYGASDGDHLYMNSTHFFEEYFGAFGSNFSLDRETASCPSTGGGGGDRGCEGTPIDGGPSSIDPYNEDPCDSPILIDLGYHAEKGITLGGPENIVLFDLWGNGAQLPLSWVVPGNDDVFLVRDINNNGIIDDGTELFGSGTRLLLQDNALAANGFIGLSQFDLVDLGGNEDGEITPADSIWEELGLWHDINADGVTQPGELSPLDDHGFSLLETIPKELRHFDDHGNWFRYWAHASSIHKQHLMIDVYFRRYLLKTEQDDLAAE